MTTLLMGDVWGQQPKRPGEPQPAPLLPAEQAWARDLPALPAAAGALDVTHAYVPLQEGGTLALVRETGAEAWTNPIGTPWPLLLVAEGVLVVATDEAAVLDRRTGDPHWRVPLSGRSIGRALATAGLIVVPLEGERLIALRAADGALEWSQQLEGLVAPARMTSDNHTIYVVTEGSHVSAIAAASGQVRWRVTLDGTLSLPAAGKDRVFVGSTSNAFYALDADTGRREWTWGPEMIGGDVIGAAADGDLVAFAGLDNLLHGINRGNGNQRWKQPTPMRPIAPPQTFGGIVAVFGVSPAIATFNARTGAAIGTYVIPTAAGASTAPIPKGPPLIDPDLRPFTVAIVIITADGRALGLRPTGMVFREQPLVPLNELPCRSLQRERLPATTPRRS